MSTIVEVQLEWNYSPKSFIEEPILIKEDGFELSIFGGVALAKIIPSFYAENPEIKEDLTGSVKSRFHAVQILSHGDFNLSKPSRSELRKDGSKNIFLECEPAVITLSSCPVDLVIKDKDGNVVSDSKQERLDKQKWFSEAVGKYRSRDNCLDQMLKSYQKAVKEPQNELVHLYEIRDALSVQFKNKKNAIKHLSITNKDWDIIGDLANSRPLEEGRHRGKSVGNIRPAEKNELETARKAASNLVEKYLIYIETK